MIYLGSDHGGYALKKQLMEFLGQSGHELKDMGNAELDPEDDYPGYAFAVAVAVAREDESVKPWDKRPKGILLCRSSGGMVIAANKISNARAVAVFDEKQAEHARKHNDANIIALSGDWTDFEEAKKIVRAFLETEFSGDARHKRRLEQIRMHER